MHVVQPDPLVGRRLGDFTLVEVVGAGTSGTVYRAVQPLLQREAAVKVLTVRKPEDIAAFLQEARLASGLDHPYAAHIYGFGAEPDRVLWLAMELVRGTTLEAWIAERGPLAAERFLPLLDRICEVVQTAHDKGIVHRDLKPANVMVLTRAGRLLPKLLDFGIARSAYSTASSEQESEVLDENPVLATLPQQLRGDITHKGLVGSPAFMAPEQWLDARTASPASDQYALGALCYKALTGALPFRGESLVDLGKLHAKANVPSLGDKAPRAIDAVIARAMAKRPEDRFASLMDLASAFRAALDLPPEVEALPKLDEALRDAIALGAPQPIAEAITTLEAVRDVAQAWNAAELVFDVVAQYAGLVALSAMLHVPEARRPKSELLAKRLAELATQRHDAAGWLDIACEIGGAFRDAPGSLPIPELATTLGDPSFPRPVMDRADLARFLADLARMLDKLAWITDYRIATVRLRALELWSGTRRRQRNIGIAPKRAVDGSVVLLDGDDAVALTVSPLVQIARPSPGMAEEMFFFDLADKRGPRLRAQPAGFDRRDPDLLDWLRSSRLEVGEAASPELAAEQPPYRGLATFTRDDAGWFFGREREIEAFGNRLRVQSLLAVVGPSGAGKSSFVQAGVLPSLAEGTESLTVRPGGAPIAALVARLARAGIAIDRERLRADPEALGAALRASGRRFVLVVDQFEELFTLGASLEERRAYSEALATAGRDDDASVRVILTLRDDFLVRSEQLPALRRRLAQGMELLATPGPDDLHRILVEPARRVGYHFEDQTLIDDMVQAVAEQPGALPLLSFTASRLWELRDVRFHVLTRRAYQTLGGVGGGLARHAEETLAGLAEDQQPLVREIFRHLVTSEGTRAVLSRGEAMELLGGGERAERMLEILVGSRLVVASEGEAGHERIEVAHEALLSAWPRLVQWRHEDAEIVRVRDQLRATARQWAERGKPRGLLWRDEVLAEYRLWRSRYLGALTELEEEFGRKCLEQAHRAVRRRRVLLSTAFVVLAAGAITMTLLGLKASRNAREANHLLVDSYFEQSRTALLDGRPGEALDYLSRARAGGLDTPALRLMEAYARPSVTSTLAVLDVKAPKAYELEISRDGSRIFSAHEDGAIRVWDVASHRLLATWKDHSAIARKLDLTRDGRYLASAADDGSARVWNVATGQIVSRPAGQEAQVTTTFCMRIDPNGELFVTAGVGNVRISDVATGHLLHEVKFDGFAVECAIDPSGKWLAVANGAVGKVMLLDLHSGERLRELPHDGPVLDVEFSPDGDELATGSVDGNVRLWSSADGSLLHVMAGHGEQVDRVEFSPDGKQLASVGRDFTARVWNVASGAALFTLRGHHQLIFRARFNTRGDRLATTSQDGTARVWDTHTGRLIAILSGTGAPIGRARFSPDDSILAGSSWDGTIALWTTRDPFAVETWPGEERGCMFDAKLSEQLAISHCTLGTYVYDLRAHRRTELPPTALSGLGIDGVHLATATDRVVTVWDLPAKQPRQRVELASPVTALDWSPSYDSVAIGTESGDVWLWRPDAASKPATIDHFGSAIAAIVWGRSGVLVAGDDHGDVHAFEPQASAPAMQSFSLGAHVELVKFSPDGTQFAVGAGSHVEVRDTKTRALRARLDHQALVINFDFDSTGERVISGAQDSIARVWRTRDGALLAVLQGGGVWVVSPTFVGDSLAMATGGDGAIRFWDIGRAQPIALVPGTTGFGSFVLHPEPGAVSLLTPKGGLMTWHIPGL